MTSAGTVISVVIAEMGGTEEDVYSPLRGKVPAVTRRWMCWLAYSNHANDRSFTSLGRVFRRDRTSIRHGIETVITRMVTDDALMNQYLRVMAELRKSAA